MNLAGVFTINVSQIAKASLEFLIFEAAPDQAQNRVAGEEVVSMKEPNDVASRMRKALIESVVDARVSLGDNLCYLVTVPVDYLWRFICRKTIDYNVLDVRIGLRQNRLDSGFN